MENYILWGFFRGNGGELYSEGFFREFGGKSNSLGDFSLDWRKIIFLWDFKGFVFELISVFTWSEFLLCLHLVESLSLFLSLNDVLGLMYCGGASLCCGLFTLGRGSNIPASSQSATNPKLAHPLHRPNYGKLLHQHFSGFSGNNALKVLSFFSRFFWGGCIFLFQISPLFKKITEHSFLLFYPCKPWYTTVQLHLEK